MESETMHAIAVSEFTTPSGYQLMTLPRPTIQNPNQVIIKVHSASVNPMDLKAADGYCRLIIHGRFPHRIGLDAAGVVSKIGKNVTKFDQVEHRLGKGVVDQNPFTAIPLKSVHFALDTADQTPEMLPIMAEASGFIASISALPSAESLEGHLQLDDTEVSIPPLLRTFLDADARYRQWRASSHGVGYAFIYPVPNAEDPDDIARWAEEGRIRSVVGATLRMGDVEQTVKVLQEEFDAGEGVGKTVLEML